MAGGHLERTGYRHGVLAVAALSALTAAMYTQSSFADPVSESEYDISSVISDPYVKLHRLSVPVTVLNATACALVALMSLMVDWHFAIRAPAYVEFVWVGLAVCLELVSIIVVATSAPGADTCSLDKTPLGVYEGLVISGKRLCSNWTAVLVTSVVSFVGFAFHFAWHIIFRLWHRATLARRPITPVDLWKTPLPKYYPIGPHESQKRDDPAFLALDERGTKPEDSVGMDPYSLIFRPIAVRKAERLANDGTVGHKMPVVNVTAPMEDRGPTHIQGNPSKETLDSPPGLTLETKGQ
ncbi:hypothetical protein RSOLAG1IB_06638 [Rhizoctonia solani AG-1 IB]|uniref:MARVEL domain-containing protein n=1 Tax=Thanatephorus cucumeris (strain AG1-IB / isolate 7/3/14) TaxID=1108050 RepID=A0A0B7FC89_THACB|nr:hypothetical protein RSOLAG1IB_06638 [Rhizoctonia solani AG-1 IB]